MSITATDTLDPDDKLADVSTQSGNEYKVTALPAAARLPLPVKVVGWTAVYFATFLLLFIQLWSFRAPALEEALFETLSSVPVESGRSGKLTITSDWSLTGYTYHLEGIDHMRGYFSGLITPREDVKPYDDNANWSGSNGSEYTPPKPLCDPLPLAQYRWMLPMPAIRQLANHETIARTLEACVTQSATGVSISMCDGTREPADSSLCETTTKLVQLMDEKSGPFWTGSMTFLAALFGIFQLMALLTAIISSHMARVHAVQLGSKERKVANKGKLRDLYIKSNLRRIDTTINLARRAALAEDVIPLDALRSSAQPDLDLINQTYEDIKKRGELIVQFGLLGTLTGMLILFGALERAESANPLTAVLQLSNMLGSLGIAFGTTIFAVIVQIFYSADVNAIANQVGRHVNQRLRAAEAPFARPAKPGTARPAGITKRNISFMDKGTALFFITEDKELDKGRSHGKGANRKRSSGKMLSFTPFNLTIVACLITVMIALLGTTSGIFSFGDLR